MDESDRKMLTEWTYEGRDRELMDYFQSIATGQIIERGYHKFLIRGHHRANSKGYVKTSILIAEDMIAERLPEKAVVHHINRNKLDNRRENLMICKDNAEHMMIHANQDALALYGDESMRACGYCHIPDKIENLKRVRHGGYYHTKCMREYSNWYNNEVRRKGQ